MTNTKERTGLATNESGSRKIDLAGDSTTMLSQANRRRDAATGLADYVGDFGARLIQDALSSALRSTWLRRADAFEAAMHKPGDFPGLCSVDQIEANNRRLAAKAQACRNHASICIFQDSGAICEHLAAA